MNADGESKVPVQVATTVRSVVLGYSTGDTGSASQHLVPVDTVPPRVPRYYILILCVGSWESVEGWQA